MIRQLIVLSVASVLVGCHPVPKSGNAANNPSGIVSTPIQTEKPAPTTGRATGSLTETDWTAGVSEIITKPKITALSTTRATGGNTATSSTPLTADLPNPKLTLDDVKRIDTSISTAPLVRLLAMKLNGIPYERFAGYGVVDFTPKLPEGTDPDAMTNDILTREPAGTSLAISRLIKGETDMAFVSRQPRRDELDAADNAKVSLRQDRIATEALVFTVNINNPARNISKQSLKSLFTGNAKTWAELKLVDFPLTSELATKPVTVAYRARGLGTEELLMQLLLEGQAVPELPISKALNSNKLVLDATNEDPETLGFTVFCYATNMQRDGRIKALSVDGVLPEPNRVASGEYPLTTPIYLLTRTNLDPKSNLVQVRKWLLAMSGQKVLAEAGYMPVITEAWTQQRLIGE